MDKERAKEGVAALVEKFRRETNRQQSEADVRANYIDWLFEHLGWDVWGSDPRHVTRYQREAYVRGAGYVDVGLKIRGMPILFLLSANSNLDIPIFREFLEGATEDLAFPEGQAQAALRALPEAPDADGAGVASP